MRALRYGACLDHWSRCLLLLATLCLSACASTRSINVDVVRFTRANVAATTTDNAAPAALPTTFRFERLALQAPSTELDALEIQCSKLLTHAGWMLADQDPQYAVHLTSQVTPFINYAAPPPFSVYRSNSDPALSLLRLHPAPDPTWFRYAIHVSVRRTRSAEVVFEATATHDSPWLDNQHIPASVLSAALQGFPAAPSGRSRILIEYSLRTDTP